MLRTVPSAVLCGPKNNKGSSQWKLPFFTATLIVADFLLRFYGM